MRGGLNGIEEATSVRLLTRPGFASAYWLQFGGARRSQERLGRFPGFDLDVNGHILTNSRDRFRAAIEH
jgi:hypothetical protein